MPIAKILESYTENLLLGLLPAADLENIQSSLERVELSAGQVLWESNETSHHLYFPVTTLISLAYESDNGSTISIATIGRSGIVGSSILLAHIRTPDRATVLQAGTAFRMKVNSVRDELAECGNFQDLLMTYVHVMVTKTSQNSICNRLHRIEEQLCRWLLDCSYELNSNRLSLTHDQIANVLGVRRESISLAISNLQKRKFIQSGRGKIRIADAAGLRDAACECYATVKAQTEASLKKFESDHR